MKYMSLPHSLFKDVSKHLEAPKKDSKSYDSLVRGEGFESKYIYYVYTIFLVCRCIQSLLTLSGQESDQSKWWCM